MVCAGVCSKSWYGCWAAVLAALSAVVPVPLALYAFAAAGKAVPSPESAVAEPVAARCSTAVVAPDADAATFADVAQAFVRSTVLR